MGRAQLILGLLAALSVSARAGAAPPQVSRASLLAAEASRAATPDALELLFRGASRGPERLRPQAVRALGRLERPELVPRMLPLLAAGDVAARTAAANALAQAVGRELPAAALAREAVMKRLTVEGDSHVRGALCEALGRLPLDQAADFHRVAAALLAASRVAVPTPEQGRANRKAAVEASRAAALLEGALRGFESLARLHGKVAQPSPEVVQRLREVAAAGSLAPHRRLALLALNAIPGGPDAGTLVAATADADMQVRRLAAASPPATSAQLARAMADPSPMVRYEALRAWGRRFQAAEGCAPAQRLAADIDGHTALLAIDLLGACAADRVALETLTRLAAGVSWDVAGGWHRPAHALVALAKGAPDRAKPELARAIRARAWQARMYAAEAAAVLGDGATLKALAADIHPNVRESAISGLTRTLEHEADDVYIAALAAGDNQLVMTAARALDGTPAPGAALPALLGALARYTATGSDTARDPRLALLERVGQLGSRAQAGELEPYLSDRDPRVAHLAASTLTNWTGQPHEATPAAPRPDPVPDEAELERLDGAALRVHMKDPGGVAVFEAVLLAEEAPLSCARIARLAAAGYYDGLSFHRVVPNFLIQGGSPGANEFVGHDRYMRDEVGRLPQWHRRGAMGVSTRGRDTGDAQLYVVTMDVPRLDHDYTVFAQVVRGIEVVDAVLEGGVIEKVEVVLGQYRPSQGRR